MERLKGKVALVTGAARGQGRSHVLTLAREGADILALDVAADIEQIPYRMATRGELEQLTADVEALDRRIIAVQGDVRQQADLDDLVARGIAEFGQIDVVVANAGVWTLNSLWDLSEEEWAAVVDVDLSGVWRTVKAVSPHMIERQEGSIILISSAQAHEGGAGNASYVAAKHGVSGLMKSAALELGPHGIRVNEICPGVIDTAIMDWQGAYDMVAGVTGDDEGGGTREMLEDAVHAAHLLKDRGMLKPQSTSNAVLWLASDESADVTGLELFVDAGHKVLPGLDAGVISRIAVENAQA